MGLHGGDHMSELNEREQTLVGLGAALASNCVPCIEYHIPRARQIGCSEAQIKEAIQIADKVRRVPARLVLQTAMARIQENSADVPDVAEKQGAGCGCAERSESGCVS